ncbi:hypothetical protein AMAG_08884 [Allomyces macrogynus ATCC 38327]|uniref:Uncharacterized protein n=1 Tax=Allomyces macrogynus (strain ATCC 38327) TaxID=578462 RepID=A0A0L0SN65_ALLM3|nr:hypothetical protein AMAG_08884 [Allomyces macrogynus ATCC 38327]|eukprot:KNE63814.1 hypothetical protein AMAG_08884 [Allomyces macrogynus ATCC 38327]
MSEGDMTSTNLATDNESESQNDKSPPGHPGHPGHPAQLTPDDVWLRVASFIAHRRHDREDLTWRWDLARLAWACRDTYRAAAPLVWDTLCMPVKRRPWSKLASGIYANTSVGLDPSTVRMIDRETFRRQLAWTSNSVFPCVTKDLSATLDERIARVSEIDWVCPWVVIGNRVYLASVVENEVDGMGDRARASVQSLWGPDVDIEVVDGLVLVAAPTHWIRHIHVHHLDGTVDLPVAVPSWAEGAPFLLRLPRDRIQSIQFDTNSPHRPIALFNELLACYPNVTSVHTLLQNAIFEPMTEPVAFPDSLTEFVLHNGSIATGDDLVPFFYDRSTDADEGESAESRQDLFPTGMLPRPSSASPSTASADLTLDYEVPNGLCHAFRTPPFPIDLPQLRTLRIAVHVAQTLFFQYGDVSLPRLECLTLVCDEWMRMIVVQNGALLPSFPATPALRDWRIEPSKATGAMRRCAIRADDLATLLVAAPIERLVVPYVDFVGTINADGVSCCILVELDGTTALVRSVCTAFDLPQLRRATVRAATLDPDPPILPDTVTDVTVHCESGSGIANAGAGRWPRLAALPNLARLAWHDLSGPANVVPTGHFASLERLEVATSADAKIDLTHISAPLLTHVALDPWPTAHCRATGLARPIAPDAPIPKRAGPAREPEVVLTYRGNMRTWRGLRKLEGLQWLMVVLATEAGPSEVDALVAAIAAVTGGQDVEVEFERRVE